MKPLDKQGVRCLSCVVCVCINSVHIELEINTVSSCLRTTWFFFGSLRLLPRDPTPDNRPRIIMLNLNVSLLMLKDNLRAEVKSSKWSYGEGGGDPETRIWDLLCAEHFTLEVFLFVHFCSWWLLKSHLTNNHDDIGTKRESHDSQRELVKTWSHTWR